MKKKSPTCRHFKPLKLPKPAYSKHLKPQPPTIVSTLPATTERAFGPVDSTLQPMFTLRAGISAQDALAHVSLLLLCAEQTSDDITELGSGVERGLIWSMVHSVEMARAVVDSLLERAG
ncbi:DUF3077 domain-containing protein [Pseudomonas sp. DSV-1]|uniref:DUF3077 domain-containing protein n=1 Tax=Pseudomonas sp. DSV-1 TaxID=3112250 RepID=UPI003FA3CFC1